MRYIVFSDVHGNIEAFRAVIKSFPRGSDTQVISAGDTVGYGANPNECVEALRSLNPIGVLGNHDAAMIGKADIGYFKPYAAEAIYWTRRRLTPEHMDYLNELPLSRENDFLTVVHGTLSEPEKFVYLINGRDAVRTFNLMKTKVCFIGHSHVPEIFIINTGKLYHSTEKKIKLDKNSRYIVNVGSVGQPRDGNKDACYAVYDVEREEIEFRRVAYDVASAQKAILDADLPKILAVRLAYGQ